MPEATGVELTSAITRLAVRFPRFANFLATSLDEFDELQPGLDDAALADLESSLGLRLPAAYRSFLECVAEVTVADTLQMTTTHPFVHESGAVALPTEGMLCFAEYWFEADGDQVLFDLRVSVPDDPPVLYYAHSVPEVRIVSDSFTAWIEALPEQLAD